MVNRYNKGETIILYTNFTDASTGLPYDPASVTLKTLDPIGVQSEPTIVKAAVGEYQAEILGDIVGAWLYRWEGEAGGDKFVDENVFIVGLSYFQ